MSPDLEIPLHDVEQHGELGEDEDPVARVLHDGQQVVQQLELAAVADQMVAQGQVLDALKHEFEASRCLNLFK